MATFEVQIEGLTGLDITASTAPTLDELTQFLTDGAKEVINVLPPNLLDICSSNITFTSTAIGSELEALNTGKVSEVSRNDGEIDQPCRRISDSNKGRFSNPSDMSYATVTDPVYYITNGRINVLPDGGSCKYKEVQYPTVAYGHSSIGAISLTNILVSSAGVAVFSTKDTSAHGLVAGDIVSFTNFSEMTALNGRTQPVAAVPSSSSFTVSGMNSSGLAAETTGGTVISGSFPDEAEYLVVLYAAIKALQNKMSSKTDDLPSDIIIPAMGVVSTSLPNYTAPDAFLMPAGVPTPSLTSVTFTSIDSALDTVAPTFTTATVSVSSVYTGNTPTYIEPALLLVTAPTISDLSIAAVTPVAPSLTSVTFESIDSALDIIAPIFTTATVSESNIYTGSAPTYAAPVLSLTAFPTITWSFPSVPVTPTTSAQTVASFGNVPTFTPPVMNAPDFADTENLITSEEDPEMLSARVQEIQAKIGEFSARLGETQAKFNKENSIFQADVQEKMQEAQLADSNEARKLQSFQNDISMYQAEVNKVISGNQAEIAEWQQRNSVEIQKYGTDVQNALNTFNKENIAYQSAIQESMQEIQVANQINMAQAQSDLQTATSNKDRDLQRQLQNNTNDMQAIIQDNNKKIDFYQAKVVGYQADISKEVQEYQQNLASDIQVWQTERQTDLQKYGIDVQSALNVFNKENVLYQSAIQESIQEIQIANQVNIAQAQSDLQTAATNKDRDLQRQLQNGVNDMQAIVNDNQNIISLYQSQIQDYQTKIQAQSQKYQNDLQQNTVTFTSNLQKYSSEVQKISSDNQSILGKFGQELADYSAKIQKHSIDYQWLQSQYTQLKQDYNQGLQILIGGGTPPPQQQGR